MTAIYSDRLRGISTGVAIKAPVRVATTGNITLSGLQTIDGVTVAAGDRVLAKSQTTPSENGIWVAATGAWSRDTDFNDSQDVTRGTQIFVNDGTASAGVTYVLDTSGATVGSSNLSFAVSQRGAPGRDSPYLYTTRAALVAAISAGDLDGLAAGSEVEFSQAGYRATFYKSTGATAIPDMPGYLPSGEITTLHFGAGLGTTTATNDTSRVQAMVNYAVGLGRGWHIVGRPYLHSTVTITGVPRMYGTWGHRLICVDGNYPAFTVVASGTLTGMEIVGVRAECTATSANTGNGFMRFTGPDTALVQRGRVEGNHLSNFHYGFNFDMTPRTSSFGLEGGVNWMDFSDNHFLNVYRAYLIKNGSGTGNSFIDDKPAIRPGGAYYEVLPETPGTVMGDLLFTGIHGNGVGGESTFIRIGEGTVYGAQGSILGNQFDANMTIPLDAPTDFILKNWNIDANNFGGASRLGLNMQPIQESSVRDRDWSSWEAGNVKSNTLVGARDEPLFDVYIPAGGVLITVDITSGDIPGIGAAYASGEYWVTYNAAGAVVVERSKQRSSTAAGALDISLISVTPTIARVRAQYTKTAGTARVHGNIRGRGESAFKIVRFEAT